MLRCPFCGSPETDRFDLEGRRFVVFGCSFAPAVDPAWDEPALAAHLASAYPADGSGAYFRQVCDRLHVYVTRGEGSKVLTGGASPAARREPAGR